MFGGDYSVSGMEYRQFTGPMRCSSVIKEMTLSIEPKTYLTKKAEYKDAAIDKSYWHIYEAERSRLNPEDKDNPIWNEEA